jgi:hypothetical protein
VRSDLFHLSSDIRADFKEETYIPDIGQIMNQARPVKSHGSADNSKCSIFGTADFYLAAEAVSALDAITKH